jgi:hypothetical protein
MTSILSIFPYPAGKKALVDFLFPYSFILENGFDVFHQQLGLG